MKNSKTVLAEGFNFYVVTWKGPSKGKHSICARTETDAINGIFASIPKLKGKEQSEYEIEGSMVVDTEE